MNQNNQENSKNPLDTFDHVVVLMLENRSFDNLLGYLYSEKYPVPPGKSFEGVDGKNLSNPIPSAYQFDGKTEVPVTRNTPVDYHKPYPDPGEDYPHVNTQIFNTENPNPFNQKPYNLPSPVPMPTMSGFVSDYITNYINTEFPGKPLPFLPEFYDKYKVIMECYDPADVPVLSGLAREFAVFDHWFCSIPSETYGNRNFWHAGTSWGHVINPGAADDPGDEDNKPNTDQWYKDTAGLTLFKQLSDWKIYSDNKIPLPGGTDLAFPLTPYLHLLDFLVLIGVDELFHQKKIFKKIFNKLADFKSDCADGKLPAYSFIEPNFFNPHNDMHPSTPNALNDGNQKNGSVLLGEALIWEIYNAIFTSPKHWNNTLLIITFDEHGGCYDHVVPPGKYGQNEIGDVNLARPPKLDKASGQKDWDDFDFERLGIRVPTIMVSPYIKKNTIINTPMSHTSFLKTMHRKFGHSSLSARDDCSPDFATAELLSPTLQWAGPIRIPPSPPTRLKAMPEMPVLPAPTIPVDNTDYSKAVLTDLAKTIINKFKEIWCKKFPDDCPSTAEIKTQGDAAELLRNIILNAKKRKNSIGDGIADAVDEVKDTDLMLVLQALSEEMKKENPGLFEGKN